MIQFILETIIKFKIYKTNKVIKAKMTNKQKYFLATIVFVAIAVATLFTVKPDLLKGLINRIPVGNQNISAIKSAGKSAGSGTTAAIILNSQNPDIDGEGILGESDKCPNEPGYIIAEFHVNDTLNYLGQQIKLEGVYKDTAGEYLASFSRNNNKMIGFGVYGNGQTTSLPGQNYPFFWAKVLGWLYSPNPKESRVILQFSGVEKQLNPDGCYEK